MGLPVNLLNQKVNEEERMDHFRLRGEKKSCLNKDILYGMGLWLNGPVLLVIFMARGGMTLLKGKQEFPFSSHFYFLTPWGLLTCGLEGILRLERDFDLNDGTEETEENESANERFRFRSVEIPDPVSLEFRWTRTGRGWIGQFPDWNAGLDWFEGWVSVKVMSVVDRSSGSGGGRQTVKSVSVGVVRRTSKASCKYQIQQNQWRQERERERSIQ